MKIFVQIAAYRDNQLVPTLKNMLENCKNPENLRICIAWQHSKDDIWDNLDEYKKDPRFNIIDIDYRDSKGVCWARNLMQSHYNEEEYMMQLDSHHRFVKDWDQILIDMHNQLKSKGYKKPVLTTYLPSYDPQNDPASRVPQPWKMNFDRFIPEGAVFFLPASIDNWENLTEPVPARFYSAHFCFGPGSFCKEVPHDPNYYFHGEEINVAVRAFTNGYDLFHPHKLVCWHEYTRANRVKQWDDDKSWINKNNESHFRNRKLFEMDGHKKDIDFGIYDFGKVRTLEDYEAYSGLNFKKRAVQKYTLDNKNPPNPKYDNINDYENSFLSIFKHCISIHKSQYTHNDYDFWVVSFEKNDGTTVFRRDADENEINNLLISNDDFINIWREFNCESKPDKWVVWMHSKSKGWAERHEGAL